MVNIAHYQIEKELYRGRMSVIYRGRDPQQNRPVVLKRLDRQYPSPAELKMFEHEYRMLEQLRDVSGVLQVYEMRDDGHTKVMVLEDIGGVSLDQIIEERRPDLAEALELAIKITTILDALHQRWIIHKDIKPHNILLNRQTNEVRLIDFGISTQLSRETQEVLSPERLEGTLAYISPEQTGRMNRSIDYRTDFYSLGVMLFELFTGQRPFEAKDPMEIVHAHIARQPEQPAVLNPEIPDVLSEIIMKLLEKLAENRYQSSAGLLFDLQQCAAQLKATGTIESFALARQDRSLKFQIPEKLYGREREIAHLMDVFDRVAGGQKAMIYFFGESGIGKSVLINEVHKPIVERRGYFISGKYEQLKRNIPHTAIIQAFQDLSRQIVTEREENIAAWKTRILQAIGNNGRVITDVIPEVELIIGPQPDVEALPPQETQTRFNIVFQNFVRVFAAADHPLVLFLDDLQWADHASLELLKTLYTDIELAHVLFIGAYRDNEVESAHPLMRMLDGLRQEGITWEDVRVQPLTVDHIAGLIADTLDVGPAQTVDLAGLVLQKTAGNPFFVQEFLKKLYSDQLIVFKEAWTWDLARIVQADITNNVIELMVAKISALLEETVNALKIAACTGNVFGVQIIAYVSGNTEDKTYTNLLPAINEGLTPVVGERVKFIHDKVKEASYSMLTGEEAANYHYTIGKRYLHEARQLNNIEEWAFDIVNQWNNARDRLQADEKEALLELNLKAGRRAKAAVAYDAAVSYLRASAALLPTDCWQRDKKALEVYSELLEAEYLATHFDEFERIFALIEQNVTDLHDKMRIYSIKMEKHHQFQEFQDAITLGLAVLDKLDFHLPEHPTQEEIMAEVSQLYQKVQATNLEEILQKPEIQDPRINEIASDITINLIIASFFANPGLCMFLAAKIGLLTLEYGNNTAASYCYGSLVPIVLINFFNDIEKAYESAQIGMKLDARYNVKLVTTKNIHASNSFLYHLKRHFSGAVELYEKQIRLCLEAGDSRYLGWGYLYYALTTLIAGQPLQDVRAVYDKFLPAVYKLKHPANTSYFKGWRQAVVELMGEQDTAFPSELEQYDEAGAVAQLYASQDVPGLSHYYSPKIMRAYILETDDCPHVALEGEKYIQHIGTQQFCTSFYFYQLLALTRHYAQASEADQAVYSEKIRAASAKLKLWSEHGPQNYLNKYLLGLAEIARIEGRLEEAMKYYDAAIEKARENSFPHEEAIANECAARFYLERGFTRIAAAYMVEARYCYLRWGCKARAAQLTQKYPELFAVQSAVQERAPLHATVFAATVTAAQFDSTYSTSTTGGGFLDLEAALKASETIAREIEMDKLLGKIMQILMANAGAQKGFLILPDNTGALFVEAAAEIGSPGEELAMDAGAVLQHAPLDQAQKLSPAIVHYVHKTLQPVVLDNASADGRYLNDSYVKASRPLSVLCLPVVTQGRLAAILYLENNALPAAFPARRVELLTILSSQAAISLEIARHIENLAEQERLKKELELAQQIQTALLPGKINHPELEIEAVMLPAEEVGGDYYDIVTDDSGHLWLAIGDVSGHGVTPGLIMMMAQTVHTAFVKAAPCTPQEVINQLNRILYHNVHDRLGEDHFMTFTTLKYLGQGRFQHAGAHLSLLVYRQAAQTVERIETSGVWLSFIADISHVTQNREFTLAVGDILVLYTDGLTEAHRAGGELLDIQRFTEIITTHAVHSEARSEAECPLAAMRDAILADVLAWCDHQRADDMTLVVVRRVR